MKIINYFIRRKKILALQKKLTEGQICFTEAKIKAIESIQAEAKKEIDNLLSSPYSYFKVKKPTITDTERLDFELSHTTEWMGFTGSKDYWELQVYGIGDKRHSEAFEALTKRECLDKAIPYIKKLEEKEDNKI